LQQAIKLLQLSNLELNSFVETELERNPLLERQDEAPADPREPPSDTPDSPESSEGQGADEWLVSGQAAADPAATLDTAYENVDPEAGAADRLAPIDSGWANTRTGHQSLEGEDFNLEATLAAEKSLQDHLREQLALMFADPVRRMIATHLVDLVDEAGYMRSELDEIAGRLGAPLEVVEETLLAMQKLDPPGVCARNLAECLTIQLKEANRYDPVIGALVDNLHLLAQHNLPALRRLCKVDQSELSEMIAEIRSLNPKPGLKFGSVMVQTLVPDVVVRPRSDGGWQVELNSDTLPKVLVNQSYFSVIAGSAKNSKDKTYLQDCLQTANWLVKSLDQRARTILRVSEEIVRQQDAFFAFGVQHLRPLNLKTVADAIGMHESTVSRVTSNKYLATNRGIFELKYFFTSAIASAGEGEAHSSESVRHRIKQLIDAERPDDVLSDDKLVDVLKGEGMDIARRTVAKYREGMNIASSVQRRRSKRMAQSAEAMA
jgi:RNA polymerase sigma-54 factor